MPEPSVCAVMLTANRPEMAKRPVECFRRQTYPKARLAILDTGLIPSFKESRHSSVGIFNATDGVRKARPTIGSLRNLVAEGLCGDDNLGPDILIHWDDDDWSHPNRIAEQVSLLQSSGADCVGYREMVFWREPRFTEANYRHEVSGEAWLYSNPDPTYALGTSLCYWRRTWQARPFEATSQGEDERFIRGLKCVGVPAIGAHGCGSEIANFPPIRDQDLPRMIARIHAGNTSTGYRPELMERESRKRNPMWQRVPAWDDYCRSVMA